MDVIREGVASTVPPRNILVAVSDSDQARTAAVWAGNYLAHREEDCLHLVTVLTRPDTVGQAAPIATMSAVAAMAQTIHQAHEEDRANAIRLLTAIRNHLVLHHAVVSSGRIVMGCMAHSEVSTVLSVTCSAAGRSCIVSIQAVEPLASLIPS